MKETSVSKKNNRKKGKFYEELAVSYLMEKGYVILHRNYQVRLGEIDIIAKKDGVTIAFEVKYRRTDKFGSPSMAVTRMKQWRISKTFLYYLMSENLSFEASYRFDVLGINGLGEVTHIKNAFDYIE